MVDEDVKLIHRIWSGDDRAFSTLVEKYQKGVHAFAWRKIGDYHYAEEITQDAFVQVYQNLMTLRNPHQFAGWLYVIVNRLCLKWLQKKKMKVQSLEATPMEEIDQYSYNKYILEQREMHTRESRLEIVKNLLDKLPESEQTVTTLYYLGEMTAKEISKFLGVSVNTIKSRLRRARIRLQEEGLPSQDILGSVQFSTNLTENILQRVINIEPTPPQSAKPLLPWVVLSVTTFLVLSLGVTSQFLSRFQKPYNFESQSEQTVEIMDVPIVFDTDAKLTNVNQVGRTDIDDNSNGTNVQVSDSVITSDKQDWHLRELPEGVKARIGRGFITGKISISGDGKRIAIPCSIGIWIYDTKTDKALNLITGDTDYFRSVAFSPDEILLASAGDKVVQVWDARTGIELWTMHGHKDKTTDVAFSPDGSLLASSSVDKTIRLWDPRSGTHIRTLTGHIRGVTSVAFSPNGDTLASASDDKTLRLWDIRTGALVETISEYETNEINTVAFSPDGKIIASASNHNFAYLHDAQTGKLRYMLKGQNGSDKHSTAVGCADG